LDEAPITQTIIPMKVTNRFSMFIILVLVFNFFLSCNPDFDFDFPDPNFDSNLIFQTSFEGTSKVITTKDDQIDDLVGIDHTLTKPNDWVADFDDHPNIGEFRIYFEDGDVKQRYAKIAQDPTDPGNQVLHFGMPESNAGGKGRIQADIYDCNGLKEIYQSVRVYFPPGFETLKDYSSRIYWLTIFELWNNPSWIGNEHPFRVSINLEKPRSENRSDLFFRVYGQDKSVNNSWTSVWEQTNNRIAVPIGEWITLEVYVREGGSADGRFYMAMTTESGGKEVVFDITNYTHHPKDTNPDGLSHFNPMKLYTFKELIEFMQSNDETLEIFWDDYKLWKDRRPESVFYN